LDADEADDAGVLTWSIFISRHFVRYV